MKNHWLSILIVSLTLGTAWAVRGQFGHEQGAAWAGGIGAMALILVSGRKDWYSKMLTVALASAIGWGAGGMISYGLVVGYGRSNNFPNAVYGLLMLVVIGGLFGLLGGGLTGMALESTKEKRTRWGSLVAEMTAGGAISYYLLVQQLEILMTPPRSEAWAVCLGAGLALLWHMVRNNYKSSLRVALITALGAGFGFAFGNFLQIVGNILEIKFNMWNVMEYSIGFFGGLSLAYSVSCSEWPAESLSPLKWENRVSLVIIFIFIPLIVYSQSLGFNILMERFSNYEDPGTISIISTLASFMVITASAIICWITLEKSEGLPGRKNISLYLFTYLGSYILVSYIVTGTFAGTFLLNHHLYLVNFLVIFLLARNKYRIFFKSPEVYPGKAKFMLLIAGIIIFIILLAFISVNIHDDLTGAHDRFPGLQDFSR